MRDCTILIEEVIATELNTLPLQLQHGRIVEVTVAETKAPWLGVIMAELERSKTLRLDIIKDESERSLRPNWRGSVDES